METVEREQSQDWYAHLAHQNRPMRHMQHLADLRRLLSQSFVPEETEEKMMIAILLGWHMPRRWYHVHHHGSEEFMQWSPQAAWESHLEEQRFYELVEKWHDDTLYTSSVTKMTMHPAYLRIIGMGPKVIPLLLHELERTRDHWLVALHAITGEDPAPPKANFEEAVEAWLEWGRQNGYL